MKKTNIPKKALKHIKKNWIKYGFETLVVIIGILMALALNNWNDNRKQNIEESEFLNGLLKDLKADTTYYVERINKAKYIVKTQREIIREMYQTQHSLDEVETLFNKMGWDSEQLTTQNTTYIELTNSGKLNILRNQMLKDNIINYYRKNEEASKHVSEFNEFSARLFGDLIKFISNQQKFYSFMNDVYDGMDVIREVDWAFMNDPYSEKFQTLENVLGIYRLKHQIFLEHFNTLNDMAIQLLKDLQKELDSRN